MAKALVTYYSRSGDTEKTARLIAEQLKKRGVEVDAKKVQDTKPEDLKKSNGVIIGSPSYYGSMAAEIKSLNDFSN